ncbi:MAG: hypothetical protein WAK96_05255, partial [Desulfobaccales bacterium]
VPARISYELTIGNFRIYFPGPSWHVGRESEAHPADSIIPSLDCERYHLPPIQGYKCWIPRIGESLNTAYP